MRLLAGTTALVTQVRWLNRDSLIRLGILLIIAGIVALVFFWRHRIDPFQLGYAGIAIAALVASGGLIVPVPALAAVCTASSFLDPPLLGVVAGASEAMGELTGYFLGYSGREIFSQRRLYQRLEDWMQRRGWLPLFLVSLIPNPFFDVIGVAAGALRYPLPGFLAVVGVGKLLKFTVFAYACAYGIQWIINLFSA